MYKKGPLLQSRAIASNFSQGGGGGGGGQLHILLGHFMTTPTFGADCNAIINISAFGCNE